ncbi:MAG: hypothetical protein CL878_00575, partial [Dehalococcoidia bacterium]|nr:hypothetical protein [Dehalococcoidia bacterium]
ILTRVGMYPYAPERAFSYRELRRTCQQAGFAIVSRTGLLFLPGWLRMLDVALYRRWPRVAQLTGPLCQPFEWLETRFDLVARHGYLIACVVRKPH